MAEKGGTHKVDIQFVFLLSLGSINACGICCWLCRASLWFPHFSDKQKLLCVSLRPVADWDPLGEASSVHSLLLDFCPFRMHRSGENGLYPAPLHSEPSCCCQLWGTVKEPRLGMTSCSHALLQPGSVWSVGFDHWPRTDACVDFNR